MLLRKMISGLCLLLIALSGQAQNYDVYPRWYAGASVFGGVTMIANQNNYGLPEPDYNPSGAIHFGGVGGVCFNAQHQLQFEINYAGLDQKYADDFSPSISFHLDKEVNLRYIQFPLTYRYVFTPGGDVMYFNDRATFYFNAGLQLSYLTSLNLDYKLDNYNVTWDSVQQAFYSQTGRLTPAPDFGEQLYKRWTLDLVGGVGWEKFIFDNFRLGVELRSFVSLTDINSSEKNFDGTYKWRIPKPGDSYSPSRNFAGGIRVVMCYFFE